MHFVDIIPRHFSMLHKEVSQQERPNKRNGKL